VHPFVLTTIVIDYKNGAFPTHSALHHHPSFCLQLVFPSQATPLSSCNISSISDMSQPSSSSSFHGLFNAALQDYENQTKTKLVQHPLAKKLEACNSVDSITAILQEQTQIFGGFRGDDGKIMKSLRSSVDVLYTLSNSTILGEVIGLVVHIALLIVSLVPNRHSTAISTRECNIYRHCRPTCCMYSFTTPICRSP